MAEKAKDLLLSGRRYFCSRVSYKGFPCRATSNQAGLAKYCRNTISRMIKEGGLDPKRKDISLELKIYW